MKGQPRSYVYVMTACGIDHWLPAARVLCALAHTGSFVFGDGFGSYAPLTRSPRRARDAVELCLILRASLLVSYSRYIIRTFQARDAGTAHSSRSKLPSSCTRMLLLLPCERCLLSSNVTVALAILQPSEHQ